LAASVPPPKQVQDSDLVEEVAIENQDLGEMLSEFIGQLGIWGE